jgi:outer membrane protein assembly factor BamB
MKMGDGHVKQEDIQWLKKTLAENKGKTLISFSHYPIADGLDNWTDIATILKESNCILSFCGHGHQFQLLNFDSIPGVMGRALKDKKGFGYNSVLINGNKVIVSERLLNSAAKSSEIAIDLSEKDILSGKELSPKPDYTVNLDSKVKAEFEYDDTVSIFSGPCIAGDTLVIYGNSTGWIKAIDIKTKTVRWQKKYVGAIYSTPVIGSGNIIFGTADGFIVGLNLANGSEQWKDNVGSPILSEAAVEKEFVYIGGGERAFYKINAKNGSIVWTFTSISGPIQGKPAMVGKNIVFGAWDTYLYCLDKNKGTLNWKWNNGKNQRLLSPGNIAPVISGKKVFIVAPDRYFTCLDLKTGKEIWRTNKHKVRESMGISPDGKHVYAKLMNDSIISVSTTSKEFTTEWAIDAGIGYDHNPCPLESSKDLVIGATKNGLIVAINTYNKTVQWKYKLGNASINKLILKNKKLWITSTEGKLMSLTLN